MVKTLDILTQLDSMAKIYDNPVKITTFNAAIEIRKLRAKIPELEEQLSDREGDLKFEHTERVNAEDRALEESNKYIAYYDSAEKRIAELEADRARLQYIKIEQDCRIHELRSTLNAIYNLPAVAYIEKYKGEPNNLDFISEKLKGCIGDYSTYPLIALPPKGF